MDYRFYEKTGMNITNATSPLSGELTGTVQPSYRATPVEIALRPAVDTDLGDVNAIVEMAMDTWNLAERVKRLSLPMYQYSRVDLENFEIFVADIGGTKTVGVAALETSNLAGPEGYRAAYLHSIFIDPGYNRRGIGRELVSRVEAVAQSHGFDCLLVKARPEAVRFFEALDFEFWPVEDPASDYPLRYLKIF